MHRGKTGLTTTVQVQLGHSDLGDEDGTDSHSWQGILFRILAASQGPFGVTLRGGNSTIGDLERARSI